MLVAVVYSAGEKLCLYGSYCTELRFSYATLYHAVNNGWLSNYPGLTPKLLRRNKPHSPATALGHITASRSNVRSSRPTQASPHFAHLAIPTSSNDTATLE